MMTSKQKKIVNSVYEKFYSNEKESWTEIDESMYYLDNLDDDQLHREADVLLYKHTTGKPRSKVPHPGQESFIPTIIKAVSFILEDYKETNKLTDRSRYVLQYYLALDSVKMIVID